MNPFKVTNHWTAAALAAYWLHMYHIKCAVENKELWFEVRPVEDADVPMWREVCESFVAGRASTVS